MGSTCRADFHCRLHGKILAPLEGAALPVACGILPKRASFSCRAGINRALVEFHQPYESLQRQHPLTNKFFLIQ